MTLPPRLFPETVTRRRRTGGGTNQFGEPEPGVVTEIELRASVQPMTLEDSDFAGGVSVSERLSVFVPQAGALSPAFGDGDADEVVVDGVTFTVESSMAWRGSHTRAILLRET